MASQSTKSKPDPDDFTIYLAVDDGSTQASVGIQVVRKGDKPNPAITHLLCLQQRDFDIPQVIAITVDANEVFVFHWGEGLNKAVLDSEKAFKSVYLFSGLKISLFAVQDDHALQASHQAELDRLNLDHPPRPGRPAMTLSSLQHMRLVEFRKEIMKSLYTYGPIASRGWSEEQVDAMHKRVVWAIPEMARLGQNFHLKRLLQSVGLESAIFVSEADANGAWRSFQIHEAAQGMHDSTLSEPQDVIVIDGGGFTVQGDRRRVFGLGDGADNTFFEEPAEASRIGLPLGSLLCLEERVHDLLIAELRRLYPRKDYEWVRDNVLRMTENSIRRKLNRDFEEYKKRFEGDAEDLPIHLIPRGQDRRNRKYQPVTITVTEIMLREWFDDAWDNICENVVVPLLQPAPTPDSVSLLLAGGLFRNKYLRDKVSLWCAAKGIDMPAGGLQDPTSGDLTQPVCRGALCMAWDLFDQEQKFPSKFTIGVGQEEEYQPDREESRHSDIPSKGSELVKLYPPGRDGKVVMAVFDRWWPLMDHDDIEAGHIPEHRSLPQLFWLPSEEGTVSLTKNIYVTNLDLKDHEPIMVGDEPAMQKVRPGVDLLQTVDIKLDPNVIKQYPKPDVARKDEDVHEVWAWLTVEYDALEIKLKWTLAPPGFETDHDGRVPINATGHGDVTFEPATIYSANDTMTHTRKRRRAPVEEDQRVDTPAGSLSPVVLQMKAAHIAAEALLHVASPVSDGGGDTMFVDQQERSTPKRKPKKRNKRRS